MKIWEPKPTGTLWATRVLLGTPLPFIYRGEQKCVQGFGERPEGKRPLGRLGVDVRIILKLILQRLDGKACNELIWLRIGTAGQRL